MFQVRYLYGTLKNPGFLGLSGKDGKVAPPIIEMVPQQQQQQLQQQHSNSQQSTYKFPARLAKYLMKSQGIITLLSLFIFIL